ncbi:hypothetical protein BN946_scf185033.g51 [Trametes cinnabarina]|uniref:Uncharacterized protein n=1 Tax=Pycnoporus cinnabarinus TaxID=5643 RepID=A0A060SXB6_PYCCI|nr:hypothetical protein BN946_scf185033.g51 [Trametes cinnabarina]
MQSNVNTRSPSHASNRDDPPSSSTLLTPPRHTELSETIARNANAATRSAGSRVVPPVNGTVEAQSPEHPVSKSEDGVLLGDSQQSLSKGFQPLRIRRNPWQTMQQYLANGVSGFHPTASGRKASASEPALAARSQVQRDAAFNSRDKALRPDDPAPSGKGVPSLLSRLSDPVPPAFEPSLSFSSKDPDAARAQLLLTHPGGKRISASEMIGCTRATSDNSSAAVDSDAGPSHMLAVPPSNTGQQLQQINHVVGVGDVSAVEQVPSENAAPSDGGTNTVGIGLQASYLATPNDPRSSLVQKLEAAKRNAAEIPTAEKAGDPSKSAQDVETAERIAERREAELRAQAQLRVKLAAAKKTAERSGALVMGGAAGSTTTIDGDLAAQEVSLRDRLKARQM